MSDMTYMDRRRIKGIYLITFIVWFVMVLVFATTGIPAYAQSSDHPKPNIHPEPSPKVNMKYTEGYFDSPYEEYEYHRAGTRADRHIEAKIGMKVPSCMFAWKDGIGEPIIMNDPKWVRSVVYRTIKEQNRPEGCDDYVQFFQWYSRETFAIAVSGVRLSHDNILDGKYLSLGLQASSSAFTLNPIGSVLSGLVNLRNFYRTDGDADTYKQEIREVYDLYLNEFNKYHVLKYKRVDSYWTNTAPKCSMNKEGYVLSNLGVNSVRNADEHYCAQEWRALFRAASVQRIWNMWADMPNIERNHWGRSTPMRRFRDLYLSSGLTDFPRPTVDIVRQYMKDFDIAKETENGNVKLASTVIQGAAEGALIMVNNNFTSQFFERYCDTFWPGKVGCASTLTELTFIMQEKAQSQPLIPDTFNVQPPKFIDKPLPPIVYKPPAIEIPAELVKANSDIAAKLAEINVKLGQFKAAETLADETQISQLNRLIDAVRKQNVNGAAGDMTPVIAELAKLDATIRQMGAEEQTVVRGEIRALGDLMRQFVVEIQALKKADLDQHNQMAELAGLSNDRLNTIIDNMRNQQAGCSSCRMDLEQYVDEFKALDVANKLRKERPNMYQAVTLYRQTAMYGQSGTVHTGKPICASSPKIGGIDIGPNNICLPVTSDHTQLIQSIVGLGSVIGAVLYVMTALRGGNRE